MEIGVENLYLDKIGSKGTCHENIALLHQFCAEAIIT